MAEKKLRVVPPVKRPGTLTVVIEVETKPPPLKVIPGKRP